MACDIDAAAEPYIIVALCIFDEALQRWKPAGPPGESAMQADRQHLRTGRSFLVESVKTVFQVIEKLIARVKSLARSEPHVVGVERVGNDQVWAMRRHLCWL